SVMSSNSGWSGLSRRHGFKCIPDDNVSIEDVLLAVGENIGYSNIKSASRMNKAIVVFLNDEQLVHRVVVEGLTIKEKFVSVLPLSSPVTKVILSNVPPFIENEKLARELARYGKLMSPIKSIPLGCKHPEVKHVLSFRRQVFVLLNDPNSVIDVSWSFNIDGVNHTVFVSNEIMKCFQCGKQGHLRKACPDKTRDREGGDNGEPSGAVVEPQAAEKFIQKAGPIPAPRLKRVYDTAGVGGSESSTSAAAEDNTGSGDSKWNIVSKKHKSKVKGLMSSGVTGGGELVRESAHMMSKGSRLPLDSSSEPRTSDAEKPCSGPGVHSDAQIQGTEAESLPRAAVSRKLESKARVSTGVTPGDEAAIKVVDPMPDKVAAAGKEDAEEGSVMWEDIEEEELSDSSSIMMDETLTSSQGRSKVYSVEQIVSFLNKTKGVRGVVQKEYFPNDQLFIYSAKIAMRKATLNELDQKQRYRLKKLISERKKMINEEKKKTQ
ncbi:UNVERIFIED_CONTAM: hypothetical protein FKN15_007030, partial [Acipenser sinensis]